MKKIGAVFFVFVLALLCLGASVWEGAAAVSLNGELPEEGYYAATKSFPRNTVVDVTNLETGRTIRVIVAASLDSPGLLAIISRDTARAIGLQNRSIGRIRMTMPSDPIAFSRFNQGGASSGDPDFDPRAALAAAGLSAAPPEEPLYTPPPPERAPEEPVPDPAAFLPPLNAAAVPAPAAPEGASSSPVREPTTLTTARPVIPPNPAAADLIVDLPREEGEGRAAGEPPFDYSAFSTYGWTHPEANAAEAYPPESFQAGEPPGLEETADEDDWIAAGAWDPDGYDPVDPVNPMDPVDEDDWIAAGAWDSEGYVPVDPVESAPPAYSYDAYAYAYDAYAYAPENPPADIRPEPAPAPAQYALPPPPPVEQGPANIQYQPAQTEYAPDPSGGQLYLPPPPYPETPPPLPPEYQITLVPADQRIPEYLFEGLPDGLEVPSPPERGFVDGFEQEVVIPEELFIPPIPERRTQARPPLPLVLEPEIPPIERRNAGAAVTRSEPVPDPNAFIPAPVRQQTAAPQHTEEPPARRPAPELPARQDESAASPVSPARPAPTQNEGSVFQSEGIAFSVPLIRELERGKYYLQVGAYNREDLVARELERLGRTYPLAVQTGGGAPFRILVGPVNRGESAALLETFKARGYRDAFVRHN
jgi:hypothetical protein